MAISTDALILFEGTQDELTTGTPGTIASGAYSASGDTLDWTNDDDAPLAAFVLKCQFDTTMPTAGQVELYAQMLNVVSTNDLPTPDDSFKHVFIGVFPIDYGQAADTDFYTVIPMAALPWMQTSQQLHFFIKNSGTSQTIGSAWQLWVTPITQGPHA